MHKSDAQVCERMRLSNMTDIRVVMTPDDSIDRPSSHNVAIPAPVSLGLQIRNTVKETFFADFPTRKFKGCKGTKGWWVGLGFFFPILEWLPNYSLQKFKGDLIAGMTIAVLAVPQDLGYAKLANLDPIYGLYSSFVPPLVYAVLGSSRDIVIGPVAVVSILLGELVKEEIDPVKTKEDYLRLVITATFFAGIVQAGLGIFRLGFIIDFLSHAAIVGFMSGAATTIALQQLKGMLGISNFTANSDFVSVMRSVWTNTNEWNVETIFLGLFFLTLLIFTKQIPKWNKKYFWIAASAPLASVILATLFVYVTRIDKHNVKIVNSIKSGINPVSIQKIYLSGDKTPKAFKVGVITGLVGLTEAVAIGRTFGALKDYNIDGNNEMIAVGAMNIFGSFTSCFVTSGSLSRSAVNYQAGVQTAMANIIMAIVVLVTLLFLTPWFHYTPNCILSAIIISAVLGLIDFRAMYLIWKTDKADFLVLVGAFFGVFFVSVEIGLLVAVVISFGKILYHVARPRTALLGNIPGTAMYRNVNQYPIASTKPGILIVRIDAAIYFSSANYIRDRIKRYVNEAEDEIEKNGGVPIQFVIIEMSPVMNIDTAGIHAFEELQQAFFKREIQLAISNPLGDVIMKFATAGFIDLLGPEWFFLSVEEGVNVCSKVMKRTSHSLPPLKLGTRLTL